jgi:uncharacterized protein YuzE
MRLRADRGRNTAYLSLDETAAVANRLVFTDEDHREAWGINFDFDGDGHLVGVEFENADRRVPERLLRDGDGLRAELRPARGRRYLYLTDIPKGASKTRRLTPRCTGRPAKKPVQWVRKAGGRRSPRRADHPS